ncbi:MAG: hypothetical protein ACM3SY_20990 [Candidatus Omnitrophota bacterium]
MTDTIEIPNFKDTQFSERFIDYRYKCRSYFPFYCQDVEEYNTPIETIGQYQAGDKRGLVLFDTSGRFWYQKGKISSQGKSCRLETVEELIDMALLCTHEFEARVYHENAFLKLFDILSDPNSVDSWSYKTESDLKVLLLKFICLKNGIELA